MHTTRVLLAGIAFVSIFALSPSAAADDWFLERCLPFSRDVAKEIEPGLSAEELQVLRSARLECTGDPGFGAAASRGVDGVPVIKITSGTIAALEVVSTALALGAAYNKSLCGGAFLEEYARIATGNVQRYFNGGKPQPGPDPFEFARHTPDYCPRITESEFRKNEQTAFGREMMINGGMRFILAHELGHIVFEHIDGPSKIAPSVSREHERQCDAFALRVLTKAGGTPLAAISAVALLAAFDDFSARTSAATHPNGQWRFAQVANAGLALVEDDPDFAKWIASDPARAERHQRGIEALKLMGSSAK